ncbi:flagellar hook-associated protein FlgL [Gracilibacillus alcaliphilus]|uniref:flagellar hook-associated protein FlgL n=1 Tax=Gracilibacillus alcaliphilus TaxID=1401441 RepID=UPI001955F68F|nr:flagellar hook-associated protein FlgL [Gracilibacillus alcaliphilus]MBM7676031.1 flagellar hook-associated protein 3 FlgL [Gracilibacillus alcaliphilus]
MRITQNMLTNNMLRNISNSYQSMGKYMDQLATGKKINRPSDDPVVAMRGMDFRTQKAEIEQFQRNIGEVHNWMDNSDSALSQVGKALERLRELAVQASNGTYEEGQRGNIASEVDQLKEHLLDIANTKVNNKYIFNGTGTAGTNGEAPYQLNEAGEFVQPINTDDVFIEVSNGTKLRVNIRPDSIFTEDLFKDLTEFSNMLRNSDTEDQEIAGFIDRLDNHIDNNVNTIADLGGRQNRIDLIENRVKEQYVTVEDMRSRNEDADFEEVIMNLISQESIHRAALSGGARIIQPSLLDFLR